MEQAIHELPNLIQRLNEIVFRLEELFPPRRFTLDGHLLGSIGEAVAAYCYGLELCPASTKGHDAIASEDRRVQIKLTQRSAVAISHPCDHLLVLRMARKTGFEEIYNGDGARVWSIIKDNAETGRQRSLSVSKLLELNRSSASPLKRIRDFPVLRTNG